MIQAEKRGFYQMVHSWKLGTLSPDIAGVHGGCGFVLGQVEGIRM